MNVENLFTNLIRLLQFPDRRITSCRQHLSQQRIFILQNHSMSRKQTGWREWFGMSRPVERFSLEELERLHNELVKQTKLHKTRRNRHDQTEPRSSSHGNKETFIETLRSIAELMIWGDQHEPRFFDFFLEKNVLYELYEILSSAQNRRGEIATQVTNPKRVLQTRLLRF